MKVRKNGQGVSRLAHFRVEVSGNVLCLGSGGVKSAQGQCPMEKSFEGDPLHVDQGLDVLLQGVHGQRNIPVILLRHDF